MVLKIVISVHKGIDDLWGFTHELFEMDELETTLAGAGIAVDRSQLKDAWKANVSALLAEATLSVPEDDWTVTGGRKVCIPSISATCCLIYSLCSVRYPGLEW